LDLLGPDGSLNKSHPEPEGSEGPWVILVGVGVRVVVARAAPALVNALAL